MPPKDIKKINEYRKLFPKTIEVLVNSSPEGGFYAQIKNFPACYTQAETFAELIEMVNDVVITALEIPEKYIPFMRTYIPPVKDAQRFNIFPTKKMVKSHITFSAP